MIRNGTRITVQMEKGETDLIVLMALAIAGFEAAHRGLDVDDEFVPEHQLTPEEIADFDLIHFAKHGVELDMVGQILGRDCTLRVARTVGARGQFEVDRRLYEGDAVDLILRAEEILAELVPMNGFGGNVQAQRNALAMTM